MMEPGHEERLYLGVNAYKKRTAVLLLNQVRKKNPQVNSKIQQTIWVRNSKISLMIMQ